MNTFTKEHVCGLHAARPHQKPSAQHFCGVVGKHGRRLEKAAAAAVFDFFVFSLESSTVEAKYPREGAGNTGWTKRTEVICSFLRLAPILGALDALYDRDLCNHGRCDELLDAIGEDSKLLFTGGRLREPRHFRVERALGRRPRNMSAFLKAKGCKLRRMPHEGTRCSADRYCRIGYSDYSLTLCPAPLDRSSNQI